ncbi:ABC transporter substrate-binding protein [Caulobacter sp. RL271]|jgi:sulfonate transport system substrate-binding protein|uniref:ABC transporter substrate-binding protein n=1 Tax=Caulobacter segnis TaxID=88688 RepID=A0ABY5A0H9_9CAUL|nr:ABC transporter substrate-binding protein [Caulobacter segnis]USQ98308.1 ABC transporter substrate-binding protein [Caulobacter segnis]
MDRRQLLVTSLAFVGLAACSRAGGGASVLKVGSQRGGTKAVLIASGALEGAPYRIEWSEFPAAAPLLEAVSAGAVDLGEAGDAPFLYAYAGGAKIKAVQAGRSGGSSTAILVPNGSSIHAPSDLRGKKIATGRGSIGHYLLLRVLESAGLKPTDVSIVYLTPGDAKAAFTAGSIDAWVTWGSYVALARLHDAARILADGEGLLGGFGYEAASEKAIAEKRPQIEDFLRRLARARRWAADNPDAFGRVLAKETGLSEEVALYTVRQYRILPAPLGEASVEEARALLDRFRAAGAVGATRDPAGAFDASFNGALT